jgi:hypothetical protein
MHGNSDPSFAAVALLELHAKRVREMSDVVQRALKEDPS